MSTYLLKFSSKANGGSKQGNCPTQLLLEKHSMRVWLCFISIMQLQLGTSCAQWKNFGWVNFPSVKPHICNKMCRTFPKLSCVECFLLMWLMLGHWVSFCVVFNSLYLWLFCYKICYRSYMYVSPLRVRRLVVRCLMMLRSHSLMKCAMWVYHCLSMWVCYQFRKYNGMVIVTDRV